MEFDEGWVEGLNYPLVLPPPFTELESTEIVWSLEADPGFDNHTFALVLIYCWMKLAQQHVFGEVGPRNIMRLPYDVSPREIRVLIDIPGLGGAGRDQTLMPLLKAISGWSTESGVEITSCVARGDLANVEVAVPTPWVDASMWPLD